MFLIISTDSDCPFCRFIVTKVHKKSFIDAIGSEPYKMYTYTQLAYIIIPNLHTLSCQLAYIVMPDLIGHLLYYYKFIRSPLKRFDPYAVPIHNDGFNLAIVGVSVYLKKA